MIKIIKLNKFFGEKQVLFDISLEISSGLNFLIGPNGAGKTTLMNSILGYYKYSGDITINNFPRNEIAFLPDNDSLDYLVTGREYLVIQQQIINKLDTSLDKKIDYYSKLFGFDEYLDILITDYSHGTTKKLLIISTLLKSSKIIIMDEPFNGLDPEYSIILQEVIKQLSNNNVTFLISSHNLELVKKLANSIIIIKSGNLHYTGSIDNFLQNKEFDDMFITMSESSKKFNYVDKINSIY